MTDLKTDTLFLTNTETLPVTLTSTSLLVESTTLTMTDTLKEVLTDFVTMTDISVMPTTVTSIWVSTDIIDMVSMLCPLTECGADGIFIDQHRRADSHLDRHRRENDDQHSHLPLHLHQDRRLDTALSVYFNYHPDYAGVRALRLLVLL